MSSYLEKIYTIYIVYGQNSTQMQSDQIQPHKQNWLVVSTELKNVSQNGNLTQIGVKIKNI